MTRGKQSKQLIQCVHKEYNKQKKQQLFEIYTNKTRVNNNKARALLQNEEF